jgi:hypothetical protein
VITDPGTGSARHADITVSVPLPIEDPTPSEDRTAPNAAIYTFSCPRHARGRRVCRIRGFVSDRTAPISGVKRVELTVTRSVGHRRCLAVHPNRKIVLGLCSKAPWLSTRLTTHPRRSWTRSVSLSRGHWTAAARATDRAGNVQSKPAHLGMSLSR